MKHLMPFFFLALAANPAFLQPNNTLRGLITYQNSGEPQKDFKVTPTATGANAVFSDDNGLFTIIVASGRPGQVLKLIVQKDGYQLVSHNDPMIVEVAIRENKDDLLQLVVVKTEEYEGRKDRYTAAIEKQLKDKEGEIAFLRSQLTDSKMNDTERRELTRRIGELREELDALAKSKDELAQRLAEIDLARAAGFVREALEKFEQEQDVKAALELLQEEKLDRLYQNALEQEKAAVEVKGQAVEGYMARARLLIADFQHKAAYKSYLKAIEADSANVSNLWEVGYFLAEINDQKQAIRFYEQALRFEQGESSKAALLNNLGNEYKNNNSYAEAEAAYREALEIRKRLASSNPERYEPDVAATQNNLGVMYSDLNSYAEAELAYREALAIYKRLALSNPERYEPDVATTQNNLGVMYYNLNSYAEAELAYREALAIRKRLASSNPERYEPDVAATQNNLGVMYSDLNSYAEAELAYREALEIYKRLASSNPERYESDVAATQNNLGILYRNLNSYAEAELAYREALEIRKRLALANPERYEPDVAMTQNNLGNMYLVLNSYAKAEVAYREALAIRKRLAAANPERYEPDVAATQNNLGNMYSDLNSYAEAEAAYREALAIRKRLASSNPQRFNLDCSSTINNIGFLYEAQMISKLDLALKASGLAYLDTSETYLAVYSDELPAVQRCRGQIQYLRNFFQSATLESLKLEQAMEDIKSLEQKVEQTSSPAEKVHYQEQVVVRLQELNNLQPEEESLPTRLANAHGSLAWHYLFNRQFAEAEDAARQGLALDKGQAWISTNLALGLLYQGKYEEAEALYRKLMDEPYNGDRKYRSVFLEDLEVLEEAGVSHPDVERIRQVLRD